MLMTLSAVCTVNACNLQKSGYNASTEIPLNVPQTGALDIAMNPKVWSVNILTTTACRSCSSGPRMLPCILRTCWSFCSSLSSWALMSHTAEISPSTNLKSCRFPLIISESSRTSCRSEILISFKFNKKHLLKGTP